MRAHALLVHLVTVLTLACIVVDFAVQASVLLVTLAVGWLLAWRRRPLGWLIIAVPALFISVVPAHLLAEALRPVAPQLSVWLDWYAGVGNGGASWAWLPPVWILLCQLPLRFPDGRLPSPRWRWFSRAATAVMICTALLIGAAPRTLAPGEPNPAFLPWIGGPGSTTEQLLQGVAFGLLALSFVVSIASLFLRYRRGTAVIRAQLRWVLWALSIAVAGLVTASLLPKGFEIIQTFGLLLYAFVPISIGIAVLRYRLYEIDRIISRTAAWTIVTLAVVGPYVAAVLLVSLLPLPALGVALATLVAAAVFLPLLRIVRRAVDRVFNREQYDAQRVLEQFGERIRTGVDPQLAAPELVTAVEHTLHPASLGIWTAEATR